MKRITMFMMAIAITMLMVSGAHALDGGGISAAGYTITITPTPTNVPGADPMIFNPSPQVQMSWASTDGGFAVNAVHASALETTGGQAYGMSADTNKVFFKSVSSAASVLVQVNAATSVVFKTTQSYSQMQ